MVCGTSSSTYSAMPEKTREAINCSLNESAQLLCVSAVFIKKGVAYDDEKTVADAEINVDSINQQLQANYWQFVLNFLSSASTRVCVCPPTLVQCFKSILKSHGNDQ